MKSRGSFCVARHGRSVAAVLVVIAAGTTAAAADGGSARGGGLVPAPRKTREELIREWDLNSDGKIDQGEAEAAASRMRRERAELRLNSGIDPVTGLPRGEEDDRVAQDEQTSAEEADADMLREEEEAAAADVRRESDERPALPGTRAPQPRPRSPEKPVENRDLNAGRKPVVPPEIERARRPLTGGTRAGGVPARAGYGSGVPSRPLNAGLPIVPRTRGVVPTPPRVDLVPPGRPGATGTRPFAPVPPRSAPSREVYNPY